MQLPAPRRNLDVLMDLTPRCNIFCKMCFLPLEPEHSKGAEMTPAVFERIRTEVFPLARHVALSCGGEPFLAKSFLPSLEATVAAGVPHVSFVTNGLLMNDDAIDKIVGLGIRRVWVSMDGATRETYEKIRIGSRFDQLVERLRALQRVKRERRTKLPRVCVSWVLMRSNVRELEQLVDLAHEVGVDELNFRHLVPFAELKVDDETLYQEPALVNEMLDRAWARARRHGIRLRTFPKLPPGRPTLAQRASLVAGRALEILGDEGAAGLYAVARNAWAHRRMACHQPMRAIYIRADGGVNPCGAWFKEPPVGELAREPFRDVVGGADFQRLLAELRGEAPLRAACAQCPNVVSGRVDERAFTARSPWASGRPADWKPKVPKILARARGEALSEEAAAP